MSAGRRGDVAQRPADTAAEHHAAGKRQAKHHQPAREKTPAQAIDELLRRLPVRQQQQAPALRVGGGLERENAADILVLADAAHIRQHAEGSRGDLRDQPGRVGVRGVLQAACRDPGARDQHDLALRQARQFFRQAVGEPVTRRQRAQ